MPVPTVDVFPVGMGCRDGPFRIDIFRSRHSKDKPAVREVAQALGNAGLAV